MGQPLQFHPLVAQRKTPSSVLFDPDARQYPAALFPAEKSRREGRKIEQRQEQISSIY